MGDREHRLRTGRVSADRLTLHCKASYFELQSTRDGAKGAPEDERGYRGTHDGAGADGRQAEGSDRDRGDPRDRGGVVVRVGTGQPPWILLVVGVHFVPLGRLFGSADLLWAGLVLAAVAIAGAVTGAVSAVAPAAVTGAFGGLVLVAAAAASLGRALRRGQPGR
jgi:hypothetical protein